MADEKRYRPNVAAIILSPCYPSCVNVFIGLRSDMNGVWQFPQGGIDEDESPKDALLRELHEEIGTRNIEILGEYPHWERYDFPETASKNKKLYNFDGQAQRYFLVRLKDESELDINTAHPEFKEYKFVPVNSVFDYVYHFKKPIYKKVLTYFKKEGFL